MFLTLLHLFGCWFLRKTHKIVMHNRNRFNFVEKLQYIPNKQPHSVIGPPVFGSKPAINYIIQRQPPPPVSRYKNENIQRNNSFYSYESVSYSSVTCRHLAQTFVTLLPSAIFKRLIQTYIQELNKRYKSTSSVQRSTRLHATA